MYDTDTQNYTTCNLFIIPKVIIMDQEMKDVVEALEMMLDFILNGKTISKIAKVYRSLYLSLIEEGFTDEQALEIVKGYRLGTTN